MVAENASTKPKTRWPTRSSVKYLLLLSLLLTVVIVQIIVDTPEDVGRSIQEIIESRGFQAETHFITSEDGYILQLVRILHPYNKNQSLPHYRKPVLLFHGFQCSGSLFITARNGVLHPNGSYLEVDKYGQPYLSDDHDSTIGDSLGFVLASRGYDVWLANYRGNIYSTNHSRLDPEDNEFWNFSIDQMIQYDLPVLIGHIRGVTNRTTLSYVGHSQGNFIMFGLLATQPRYKEIIQPFIALSPVVYTSKFNAILAWGKPFQSYIFSLFPRSIFTNLLKSLQQPFLCTNPILKYSICHFTFYSVFGSYREQIDFDRMPVYLDNAMLGSSTRNYLHFLQMFDHGEPVRFDLGSEVANRQAYGTDRPPPYRIGAVNSSHIALIYTRNDWFLHLEDVKLLKKNLRVKLLDDYEVPLDDWNHMDLLWGKEVGKWVNTRVLQLLDRY